MNETTESTTKSISLSRDVAGRMVLARAGRDVVVHPVRAFPLSEPSSGVSLVDASGHEAAWLEDLSSLEESSRRLLEADLAARDFRPVISRIVSVSTFATPSQWLVETDRGSTHLTLKAEEDIRRLEGTRLLITSSDGLCFEVADRFGLDRASRRLLERFL